MTAGAFWRRDMDGLVCNQHKLEGCPPYTFTDGQLAAHTLEVEHDQPWLVLARLRHPSYQHMQGVLLVFVPEPAAMLAGDLCPGRARHDNKGIVGRLNLGTFLTATDPCYLAEKFGLETLFQPRLAAEVAQQMADAERDRLGDIEVGKLRGDERHQYDVDLASKQELEETAQAARELDATDEVECATWRADFYRTFDVVSEDIQRCYGFDDANMELLVAIQRRFTLLWRAYRREHPAPPEVVCGSCGRTWYRPAPSLCGDCGTATRAILPGEVIHARS